MIIDIPLLLPRHFSLDSFLLLLPLIPQISPFSISFLSIVKALCRLPFPYSLCNPKFSINIYIKFFFPSLLRSYSPSHNSSQKLSGSFQVMALFFLKYRGRSFLHQILDPTCPCYTSTQTFPHIFLPVPLCGTKLFLLTP